MPHQAHILLEALTTQAFQTTNWQVGLSSMNFQMGVLGIHYMFH
jgi:hypothetical protein